MQHIELIERFIYKYYEYLYPKMNKNQSLILSAIIFGIITILHLLRVIFGWLAEIAGITIPIYISYIAIVVSGYLTWHMYNTTKSK